LATVLTGLDVLAKHGVSVLKGARVGLVTNPSAINRSFASSIDCLHARADFDLKALFGPEHGVRGDAQAGVKVASATDARTGLPVHSLYGDTRKPTSTMLEGLDALVFDIQDFGVRYATYVATMIDTQEAAAEAGLRFVVLDRPNPLGDAIEGALLDPAYGSFVGAYALPVLHGMTVGELARMVAAERDWPEPTVVAVRGWRRHKWFDQTCLPWVPLSPNLPTLDTLAVYGGTCLLEGTNLSEGRGTTRPFEIVGAPWFDPFTLAEALTRLDLPGVVFRPTTFTPTFGKHAGVPCGGVQLHVSQRAVFRPVATGVHVLEWMRRQSGDDFRWVEGAQGFFVDLLLGGSVPRLKLDTGGTATGIIAEWAEDERAFRERRKPFLLYGD
jgi:uncharacterized protein YbbC (DUF1343 family)